MLLDYLTYIIEADNKKLNQEIGKSEDRVDDFTDSMKEAEKQSEELEKKIKEGFKKIGTAILATVAVSKLLSSALDYAGEAGNLLTVSENLGLAVEDVDALGRSVERLGGDAKGAQSSLQSLGQYVGQALKDEASSAAKDLQALGVALRDTQGEARTTMQVMGDLAEAVSAMERPQAIAVLQQVGITDQKTIELMLRGRQEMENLIRVQKESGVITKEQAEQARRFTEAMARYRQAARNSADAVSRALLPVLTSLLNRFSGMVEWMNRNEHFVKGFFTAVAGVLTVIYLPAMLKAVAATWALIAPYAAVAAAIIGLGALFGLLYDDVMHFLDGHDSLIGRLSEDYPAIGEIVKVFANNIRGIFKLLTGDWEGAKEAFSESGEAIKNIFGLVKDSVIEDFNALLAVLLGGPESAEKMKEGMVAAFQALDRIARNLFSGLKDFVQGIWDWIKGIYENTVGMAGKVSSWVGDRLGISGKESKEAPSGPEVPVVTSQSDDGNKLGFSGGESKETPFGPEVPVVTYQFGGGDNGAMHFLGQADANPMNSMTSQSIANYSNSRSETNVQVGEINIQTQATDSAGIAGDIRNELRDQLADVQNEAASGVAR